MAAIDSRAISSANEINDNSLTCRTEAQVGLNDLTCRNIIELNGCFIAAPNINLEFRRRSSFSNEKTYMCANYSKIARLIYFRRSSVEHLYDNKSSLCESWDEYQIDLPKRELGHRMERCDL